MFWLSFFLRLKKIWTSFEVFTESVTILLLFYVLGFLVTRHMGCKVTSPTRDRTCTPCIGRQSLNHWTTREVSCSDCLIRTCGAFRKLRSGGSPPLVRKLDKGWLMWAASVVSDSLFSHELYPPRFLCPGDSPGKNIGVGCHDLL